MSPCIPRSQKRMILVECSVFRPLFGWNQCSIVCHRQATKFSFVLNFAYFLSSLFGFRGLTIQEPSIVTIMPTGSYLTLWARIGHLRVLSYFYGNSSATRKGSIEHDHQMVFDTSGYLKAFVESDSHMEEWNSDPRS